MQAQSYVVGYYPLPIVFPARMLPEEDIAEFVKVPESVEIGKSADMAPSSPKILSKNKSQFWKPLVCTGISRHPSLKRLSSGHIRPSASVMQEIITSDPSTSASALSTISNSRLPSEWQSVRRYCCRKEISRFSVQVCAL